MEPISSSRLPLVLVKPLSITLSLPKHFWIMTVLLALTLLSVSAAVRERSALNQRQLQLQHSEQRLNTIQAEKLEVTSRLGSLKTKEKIEQLAQEKLNYIKPNEIIVIVK